jgi:phosphoribosylamine-glycine ligase
MLIETKKRPQVVYINRLHYIIVTYNFEGLAYATKLQAEGNDVVMMVLSSEEVGKELDPESEKKRIMNGDGMIKKYTTKEIFELLSSLPEEEKVEYFCDNDFNWAPEIAQEIKAMGIDGLYPEPIDREMEEERQMGQDMVKNDYRYLKLPEEGEYKSVEDAKKVIETTDKIWVIKPNLDNYKGEELRCYVPVSEDIEMFKQEAIGFLDKEQKGLEKGGFIMQEKIWHPVEVIPEGWFYKGKLLWADCDIEYKKLGSGEVGPQRGCMNNLCYILNDDSKLVDLGLKDYFPTAEKRNFTNTMDAGILFDQKTKTPYFTEFCSGRKGWASTATIFSMMPSISHFYECIKNGIRPTFEYEYGFAIVLYNLGSKVGIPLQTNDCNNVWLMDVKNDEENGLVTTGFDDTIAYVTGQGKTAEEAIQSALDNMKNVAFSDEYWRTDNLTSDQWYEILFRYKWLESNGYHDTI